MAERVKRRVAAARLAVAFVAAGTIAGASAWAQSGPAQPAGGRDANQAADRKAGKGQQEYLQIKLTSADISNYSLKYIDFAKGQVPSMGQFQMLDQSFRKHKHLAGVKYEDLRVAADNANGDLNAIKGELGGYIKTTDADARYIKVNEAIMGDGSVFTATREAGGPDPVPLVVVPNLINVDILPGEQSIRITNTGSGSLDFTTCAGIGQPGVLTPGDTLTCATGEQTEVLQLVGPSQVTTLTFSSILLVPAGNVRQYSVQVVVGRQ